LYGQLFTGELLICVENQQFAPHSCEAARSFLRALIRRDTFRTPQQKLLPLITHPVDSLAAVPTAAVVATT
jgi:hypothetical protein